MANLTKEDIRSVIEIIKELYLEDMIPWICGYSGGKDSTAVVQLVGMHSKSFLRTNSKKLSMLSVQILWLNPGRGYMGNGIPEEDGTNR